MSSKLTIFVFGVLLTISAYVALSTASSSTAYETRGQIHIVGGGNWPTEIRTVIYPTADVYAFGEYEVGYSRSQLKFDISGIPSGADIISAKLWLYRFAVDNWDGDVALNRVENQAWDETITASEFDAQILTDEENHASKFMLYGWDYLNVLTQLRVDHDAGHTYTSFRLRWANDDESEPSIGVDDGRFLLINSEANELSIIFCASEYDGHDPYLEVIHVPPYPVSPWPKFRRDLRNTGRSPSVGPPDNTLKWSYPASAALEASPSIGPDGTIYIGGFDGKVYAVNPDGTLKWTYPTGDKIHSSPAIDKEGTIYIGSRGSVDGTFYALNPDGTLKWSHFISQVYSPPTVAPDGTIYVGSRDYKLYAFNPDGTVKWSFATGGYIYSCPAIDPDGTIYFGSYDGNLYALNPDGTLKWPYGVGSYIYSSPTIAEDGTIYVGTAPGAAYGGDLYAINPDGTLKWKFPTGNRIYSSAAVGPDNTIYVGSDDGKLYALYDNGSLKWSYTTGYSVQSSPAVDANSDIYVGSGRDMFALNPNGTLKWKYATGSSVISSPAIDNNGTVYFGSLDGNLYAIKGTYENSANPDPPPTYVYLTWATPDTAHTINVSWRTDENYVGEVRYDNGPRGGDPGAYSYSAGGTGGLTTPELAGYIHHVELTGLEPDTIYYFICGNSSYGWSDEQSFRTAPDQRTSFRFATGGDSRDDARWDYHAYWPSARDDVSSEMAGHDPSFVLFLGDYLWSSEDPGQGYAENDTWDNWLGTAFERWRTSDNRMIPLIPVIGNHEIVYPEPSNYDPETDATNYYTVFNLPGNERWYALSWGPDLRIIVLDGEVLNEGSSTWQEQLGWLESELENSENYPWKVVAFHRPIVSSGWDGWNWHGRLADWGYLFTKYGVNVVFQAHIHWYERSYPIDSDPPPGGIASPGEGVIYTVSGGWGGPLSSGSPQWYTAYGPESTYHFMLIDVFENGMFHSQAIDRYGTVFDEFSIYRSVEVTITPSENSGLLGENVNFEVTVRNTGSVTDSYGLTVEDNAGWSPTLGAELFENVAPNENRVTTLSVIIPDNAVGCARDNITVTITSRADNAVSDNNSCIVHAVIPVPGVLVSISPGENENAPGDTVTFTVTVTNEGNVTDTYTLENADTKGWTLSLSSNTVGPLGPGESANVTLEVTIPSTAENCTRDNITVTATSQENSEVSDNDTCTAHAVVVISRGVSVSISPPENEAAPGVVVTFIVTTRNTGTITDNYDLTVEDTTSWSPTLDENLFEGVAPGENRTTTLRVLVPGGAAPGTEDEITITATSQADNTVSDNASCTVISLIPHDPIYIDGNDDFTPANGVVGGSGAENDPYVIENWVIDASRGSGTYWAAMQIRNTTAYFTIRNCLIKNGSSGGPVGYDAIWLYGVVNGTIENCTFRNNRYGIGLYAESDNNTLSNNIFSNNAFNGIHLIDSSNNTIDSNTLSNNRYGIRTKVSHNNIFSNNICSNNTYGIRLKRSDNNTLFNNALENNDGYGIQVYGSDHNILSNNTFSNNGGHGISVYYGSHNNTFSNNTLENNSFHGIYFNDSSGNLIYHNNFVNNINQAYDDGPNYWDDSYPSGGNYWSDYTGVDENHGENQDLLGPDNIGDTPYEIPGGLSEDRYPLMNPVNVNYCYESFESGFDDWVKDADVPLDPNNPPNPVAWSVSRVTYVAYSGQYSVELYIDGTQDDGTVWIERKIPVTPNVQVQVEISFQFYSENYSWTTIAGVVAYAGTSDPEVEADFTVLGPANQVAGWKEYTYATTLTTGSNDELWVAVGITVLWETHMTYNIDDVEVMIS